MYKKVKDKTRNSNNTKGNRIKCRKEIMTKKTRK